MSWARIVCDRWTEVYGGTAMFARRAQWDQRRKEASMPQTERVTNTLAAWLNGDLQHCWLGEQLSIECAVVDGQSVVVLFKPTDGGVPFRARFGLMDMELQTTAQIRQAEERRQELPSG